MSKEYKLDILKENKVYNDTVLALWSGQATYQDYLASAMLIMGYDLRQNIGDLCMMDLGQNNEGTNKVIQLHGMDKSLVLWYTNGYILPILAYKEGDKLLLTLYSHENFEFAQYMESLSTKDLYSAGDDVFNKLLELATSEISPLAKQFLLHSYTMGNDTLLTALSDIMDDPQNITINVGLSLTNIFELLKSESNKEINLPSGAPEDVKGFMLVEHYLPKMTYSVNASTPYSQYKQLIAGSVKGKNGRYADGSRIILSKDLLEVRVYDDKGLYYSVPILELKDDFGSLGIENTQNKFMSDIDFGIEIAKRANGLYAELEDLKGVELTSSEVIWGRVNLFFKKTNWTTNKVVEGTISFKPDYIDYAVTFKTSVKGVSQKLKLSEEETLVLPTSPLEYTKIIKTEIGKVSQAFHVGLHYVESAKLADILQTNGLLVQDKKN